MSNKLVTTLDRRHTGFSHWKYYINKPGRPLGYIDSKQKFMEWRAWCWDMWGASKELYEYLDDIRFPTSILACHNKNWCWRNDKDVCRIYLRSDDELSYFLLRWS